MLNSIKFSSSREKISIGIGIGFYFLSLIVMLGIIVLLFTTNNFSVLGSFPLNLLIVEVILSLPAIPSAFIACCLSKKRNIGLISVFFSGIIVIALITLSIIILLATILLGPPPIDHYQEFSTRMTIWLLFVIYPTVIFPIAGISFIFAVIIEYLFLKLFKKTVQKV